MAFDLDDMGARADIRIERGTRAAWVSAALDGALGAAIRLMWRPRMDGFEHLPDGPFLLVANHSGGGVAEGAAFLWLWRRRFGDRRLAPMFHVVAAHLPGVATLLRDIGGVPSTRAAVRAAFEQGVPVLAFPGGDHETWRPFWHANRVDMGGRKGFLRLARDADVPIVPMVFRGSHHTAPVLWRSALLPKLMIWPHLARVRALPLSLSGAFMGAISAVVLAPHWGWLPAILVALLWFAVPLTWSIPWVPATITARIGRPIAPAELMPDEDAETLDAAYDAVVGAMQDLIDDLGESPPS